MVCCMAVRNAKFNSCFLAPGDRLDEAVLGLCIALLRGNIGVFGLIWALKGYLATSSYC